MWVCSYTSNILSHRQASRVSKTVLGECGEALVIHLAVLGIGGIAILVFGIRVRLVRGPVVRRFKRVAMFVVLQMLSLVPFVYTFTVWRNAAIAQVCRIRSLKWRGKFITAAVHGTEVLPVSRMLTSRRGRAERRLSAIT